MTQISQIFADKFQKNPFNLFNPSNPCSILLYILAEKGNYMQKSVLIAFAVAIISGFAVGIQSSLNSAAGKLTGATLTGLLVNLAAGIVASLILMVIYFRQGGASFSALQIPTLGIITAAGIIGIGVITGIAFSLPKIGIAAGLSAIITGQMIIAVVIDTFGLTGGESIPLNWTRIGGIGLLALGAWAILPRG